MFEMIAFYQADPQKAGFGQRQLFWLFATAKQTAEAYPFASIAVNGQEIARWNGALWTVA